MFKHESLLYRMLLRVQDFGNEHQALFPATSTAGQAFATVADAIEVIERESATRLVTAQAGKKERAVARQDVWERLRAIARTARTASRSEPQVVSVFRLPRRKSDLALLTAATAFIREGEAVSQRWVPLGLPETSVADLRTALEAFERAIEGRRAGMAGQTAAREALRKALRRGFDAVRELDAIVANTPQLDPVVLAVWKRGRRVNPQSATQAAMTPVVSPGTATAAASSDAQPAKHTEAAAMAHAAETSGEIDWKARLPPP